MLFVQKYGKNILLYLSSNLACLVLVGYGNVRIHQILNLGGDTTQVLNFAKSYIDGYSFRFNPSLGYPGVQDNLFWPTFDFTGKCILWIIGHFTKSAEISYHLLYITGICLMTSGILFCFSRCSIRPWVSLIGACAFVATPFFASRALGHDFLSLYYGVAFGSTLGVLVASMDRAEGLIDLFRRPSTWICVWFAGTSGIYYAFFTCLFVCLGGIMNAAWQRRSAPLLATVVLVAVIGPLVVLTGYGPGLADVLAGRVLQVQRAAFEQIVLGLNPAEAVGSLATIPGLGWTLDNYRVVLPLIPGAKGLYEWPSPILSLVIFAAPFIVAVLSRGDNAAVVFGCRTRLIQISALFITFGVLYAIRGGIAYYFNLLVSPNIRGTDRIMPFLTLFAIVIVCALIEMALNLRRRWLGWTLSALGVASLCFGIWPNVGVLASKQALILSNPVLMESIASTRRMLLVKDGAAITTVLQLPNVAWPEQPPIRAFDPYAHQNAFILDRAGATTRWSYGSAVPQPAFKTLQRLVTDHVTSGLDGAAHDLGFDGILIEKAAYDEVELAQWRANIEGGLGAGCKVFDDRFRTLYALKSNTENCMP